MVSQNCNIIYETIFTIMNWKPWDWIVIILTTSISIILIFSIAYAHIHQIHYSEKGKEIIQTTVTSILSIIGVYIGSKMQKNENDSDK